MRFRFLFLLLLLLLTACTVRKPGLDRRAELEEREIRHEAIREASRQGLELEARTLSIQFLEDFPEDLACPSLHLFLARTYQEEAKFDLSLHHLGLLEEQYPKSRENLEGRIRRAELFARRGMPLRSATLLDRWLEDWPASAEREEALLLLQDLVNRGLDENGLREFRRRRPDSPRTARAALALAEILIRELRPAEARPILASILEDPSQGPLHPRCVELLSAMGLSLPGMEDVPDAEVQVNRIGILAPLSGRFSVYGEAFLEGARMALSRFNAEYLANYEMLASDTRGEPVSAALASRDLISRQGVVALLGEVLTNPTVSAAVEANARQVPLLSPSATAENIHEVGDWVFQNSITSEAQVLALVRFAFYEGLAARYAVLYPRQGNGQDLAHYYASIVQELGGEIVASVPYEVGMTDFSRPLEEIRDAQPEVLFVPGEIDELLMIVPQLAFHDIYGQILGNESWNSRRLARMGGDRIEGAIFPSDLLLQRDRAHY
ncbi:MAG: ABC transporter substrate-binding protein, partial [Candidatus Krumholzibacteria bacterium]|nr:ABC transporter substrate-binding protein [Candidatus Krumholzibacteria bacterium]